MVIKPQLPLYFARFVLATTKTCPTRTEYLRSPAVRLLSSRDFARSTDALRGDATRASPNPISDSGYSTALNQMVPTVIPGSGKRKLDNASHLAHFVMTIVRGHLVLRSACVCIAILTDAERFAKNRRWLQGL